MNRLLPTRMVEKPWGADALPPPFAAPPGRRIGEVWFEPPDELPELLAKYIFTSEALSIQVHPSDAQLPGHGKAECWLVIAGDPGARLGVGFIRPLDREAMRAAALDGSIEHLMAWHAVAPGDLFLIPPGTVHAIGAGVSLIEVQQNSDVTYRLYDYGRPRELHLDEGLGVAQGAAYPPALHRRLGPPVEENLVDCEHFRLDRLAGPPSAALRARYPGALLVLPRAGEVRIGELAVRPGACALADDLAAADFSASTECLIAQPTRT